MSVLVLLTATVKPEEVDNLKAMLVAGLPDTRAYDGCQGVETYFEQGDLTSLVLVEYWDSREHHQRYVQWRTETGVMAALGATMSAPPNIQYFDKFYTG